ncbi:MAG: SGNH/GDSL hydrolase family protein [Planctomycetes bacterium]|nr:SGNH/GDSL hydrolase family protein [Planctomycetota bacterium]
MTNFQNTSIWFLVVALFVHGSAISVNAEPPGFLKSAERIVFLGDSITYAGHYVSQLETQFRLRRSGRSPEMINLGLPSETCSGLSEPDHPYPRPNIHERLQRALDKTKPDVVVACYGMNDGIYYPFSKQRFATYQDGINRLIKTVRASDARIILLTPPAFDPLPQLKQGKLQPVDAEKYAWFSIYEGYDEVMERYAKWIMQQANQVDMVIDLHTPMNAYLKKRRTADPDFTFSPDGIHANEEGHQVISAAILSAWGMGEPHQPPPTMLALVENRQRLLRDAWLSHVRHLRPDVQAGLPLEEAKRKAKEIESSISEQLFN